MADDERLKPARLTSGKEGRPFKPGLPWKWILLGGGFVILLGVSFGLRQWKRIETLRRDMHTLHAEVVTPAAERVDRFRERLERMVQKAAAEEPEPWADPRLDLAGLHGAQGLYLRIPAEDAGSSDRIAGAARAMGEDAFARCMGLSPISVRGLYERLDFLSPEWTDQIDEADGLMRLRVLDDELARHVKRDLPMLLHMVRSDYLLLVLERGGGGDDPVDVHLWDLRDNEPLLRTRVQAGGTLLSARISMGDAPRRAAAAPSESGGARECAIAGEVKALAGSPAATVDDETAEAMQPEPESDAGPADD